jgi:energy-coupling factor transporter ATP-binding protein EcfA2
MAASDQLKRGMRVDSAFTPAAPIRDRDLFAGRVKQITSVVDAVLVPGRHVIIYGERGVGKTSLANIMGELLPERFTVSIRADTSDTYDSLWRKAFRRITLSHEQSTAGFNREAQVVDVPLSAGLPTNTALVPDHVLSLLSALNQPMIIIVDEFDRVADEPTKTTLADTIKATADTLPLVTIVIVGVAGTVNELIGEHPSIERNLRQIKLPRMTEKELREIVEKGLKILEMTIEEDAMATMTWLSQGFPHFTHLLANYSAKEALKHHRTQISWPDLAIAIEEALGDSQESIRNAYQRATIASRKETLFPSVLLAAALAEQDEFGAFRATDMLPPLARLTGRELKVPHIAYHLGKLSSPERGKILVKVGGPKRSRYMFSNAMMQPFIVLKGVSEGLVELMVPGAKDRDAATTSTPE